MGSIHVTGARLLFVLALVLISGGCGGNEVTTYASNGGINVSGMLPAAVPGPIPTPVTITGADFRNVISSGAPGLPVPELHVTFIATPPATPFLGGTSDRVTVLGVITSAGTITTTSPAAVVCGPMNVTARVRVTMPSGVVGESGAAAATFLPPTLAGITATGGGNAFPAATPTGFTLTGTNFAPVGGTVLVHWQTPAGAAPLFGGPILGPPAFPANPQVGTVADVTTTAVIADATTITGASPPAVVCEAGVTLRPAAVDRVEFPDGSCTPAGTNVAVQFRAPTLVTVLNNGVAPYLGTPQFAAAVPEPFRLNGADFGPVGGTAVVTFTHAVPGPLFGGNPPVSFSTTVLGMIASETAITGVASPAAAVCGTPSEIADVSVTLPGGSCTPGTLPVTFFAPAITGVTNVTRLGVGLPFGGQFYGHLPETFRLVGTDFGPVGGTAVVTFTDDNLLAVAPLFNPATPFENGTSDTTGVVATITSRTTIEGLTPAAVIALDPAVAGIPALVGTHFRGVFGADVTVLLEGGSCPDPALPFNVPTLFSAPVLDPGLPGAAPTPVVSTIRLNEAAPDAFTLTGAGFGLPGDTVQVIFEEAQALGAPYLFDGGATTATVVGTVVNETTITGTLPTITAPRLADSFNARVQVRVADGSNTFCEQEARFVAPPTITSALNLRPPFQQAATLAPQLLTWLACVAQQTRVEGNAFDPALVETIYQGAIGPASPVGGGVLTADPSPAATPRVLTDNAWPALDTLVGWSPVDATLTNDTPATFRVVNPDGQFHELAGATVAVTGALSNENASARLGQDSDTSIAVNPNAAALGLTPGTHAAVVWSDGFAGGSTQVFLSVTRDGGLTWSAPLQLSASGLTVEQPLCSFDASGNLLVFWLERGAATDSLFLWGSGDGGVSPFVAGAFAAFSPPLFSTSDIALDVGPNNGPLGGQVAMIAAHMGNAPDRVEVYSLQVPALGGPVLAGFYATVSDAPPALGGYQDCGVAVGPSGEVYVTWVNAFGTPAPSHPILCDVDLDGLGPIFGFGADSFVLAPGFPGAYAPIPAHGFFPGVSLRPVPQVIRQGPNAGRCVLVYNGVDETAFPGVIDMQVFSTYSDTNAFTWSAPALVHGADPSDQFHGWLASDPVTGRLHVTWYDARNGPGTPIQRFSATSANGATWSAPLLLSQARSDESVSLSTTGLSYRQGGDAYDGCVWGAWADNSDLALASPPFPPIAANPDGTGDFDAYVTVYMQR